jgi:hypothetical protein
MTNNNDDFYSDDVQASAIADDNQDPKKLKVRGEEPVTTGDIEIGDMDTTSKDGSIYDEDGDPSEDESAYTSPD